MYPLVVLQQGILKRFYKVRQVGPLGVRHPIHPPPLGSVPGRWHRENEGHGQGIPRNVLMPIAKQHQGHAEPAVLDHFRSLVPLVRLGHPGFRHRVDAQYEVLR